MAGVTSCALTAGTRLRAACTLSIFLFLISLGGTAFALSPDRDIHQLVHRSWGEQEGYPGRAQDLAQTTDGFLWIATDKGLFRFDGVRFERYTPASGDKLSDGPVRGLRAISDGSLWIAYRLENKICVLRNGNLKCYGNADGVTSYPDAIVQDHEGTLWANTWNGLIRFNGTRWERIGNKWNFPEYVPEETSGALFVDSRGTLWTGVNHTVLYLKQGSKRFEPTGVFAGYSNSIAEAPDGMIWLSDNLGYVRAISTSVSAKSAAIAKCEVETPSGKAPNCPGEDPTVIKLRHAGSLLFDRNGSLWMTGLNSGVFRVSHPERLAERRPVRVNDRRIPKTSEDLQNFTSKDGLSSDSGAPVLEDREGNIWVATRDGLDQFRDGALVPIALPKSLIRVAIAPADNGDLWAVGSWAYVARIRADSSNISLVPADAFKAYRDAAGATWLLGDSLEQWKDGAFRKMAPSPYGFLTGPGTWQVVGDRFGRLWAFSNGHGFFSLDHNRWKAWATPAEVAKLHVADMFCDSTDLIWVSTYEGDVITLDKGDVKDYPVKSDSPLRNVKAFAERAPHEIWVGGAGGLALIDSGRIRPIKPEALDSLNDVTGVVDAGSDGLWLNTANGVIHVSKDEVDRALSDPSYRFQEELFDSSDGLPGQSDAIYPFPKAVQGTDGRIWFTAARGLAWVDPKNRKYLKNAQPPPISITSISAGSSLYTRLTDLRLPSHTANLHISYTALSLSIPERVRFRYKLEGLDKDWQDAGTRRQAFYTNLGPGSYRFRVIACNNDGVWNEVGDQLDFSIAPAWFQTNLFRAACLAAFALLLWTVYRLRVRSIQLRSKQLASINTKLETQIAENAELYTDLQLQVGLLQHLPVSAWTLKPDGSPDFVNQVWLEFAGQTPDFVRSHPEAWMTAVHPEDREMAVKAFWDGVHSEHDFAFETRSLRAQDGTYRWHLQQAVALRDAQGKVLRFVGTTTDIHDQKCIEEALRQAQSDLARIHRATTMGELAASLAHEISQPISGAVTNANVCLRRLGHDKPDLDEVRAAVARIVRDGERAAEILGKIRSQFQKGVLYRELLDVNQINRDTIALLRGEAMRYNITIRTEMADVLPHVIGDHVQLQQVVMNLIMNSIEAMKDVARMRELVIRSAPVADGQILVSLSDTGTGFPPELARQIFDPFFTTKPNGTGMGLRISQSIIESHGGRLWAESAVDQGATFNFTLPAANTVSG